jgi:hypothetical protein
MPKLTASKYMQQHPYNPKVVEKIKAEIKAHVKSCYPPNSEPKYKDWYFGIAENPDTDRVSDHKSEKKLEELKNRMKIYAHSLSNARQVEFELCNEFGLDNCKRIGRPTIGTKWVYAFDWANSKSKN